MAVLGPIRNLLVDPEAGKYFSDHPEIETKPFRDFAKRLRSRQPVSGGEYSSTGIWYFLIAGHIVELKTDENGDATITNVRPGIVLQNQQAE